MIPWLSNCNYDFTIATIPIQIILMIFYCARRNLPIRASRSFLFVLITNLILTISNIAVCELNALWPSVSSPVIYIVNIIFLSAFAFNSWRLFDYCAEVCQIYRRTGLLGQLLSTLPCVILLLMIVTTPWTRWIFFVSDATGYAPGALFSAVNICAWFYILYSVFTIILCRKYTSTRLKAGLFCYNAILLAGISLQRLYPEVLLVSFFSVVAVLLIFLTSQNPDLYRDRQTHLFNRDAFDVIGTEFLNKNIPFHCVIISAHNYESAKLIYGYSQLERCLLLVGRWMITHFKGYYVFYFGGGNYILVRKGTFQESRDTTLPIIKERFEHSWADEDTNVTLQMAALVLPYEVMPDEIHEITNLIDYACRMAYRENHRGREIVEKDMVESLCRQTDVELALGTALEERRLEAWFQPIYSTEEQRIVGAEALARLKDPVLGYIPPSEFIEIAEQTGDIMELGRQIFELVCLFAKSEQFKELGLDFINVNLSPAQCMNEELAFELSAIAEAHQIPMSMLDFEITETSVTDYSMIKKQMLRLQDKGAELSLDDFGSGMSNLASLMELPIHIVKIDMDVVRSYFSGSSLVLPDLIHLFQNADMQIVVEGVETEEMKVTLTEMGCDFQQGFFFSRPLPPDDFLNYIKNSGNM